MQLVKFSVDFYDAGVVKFFAGQYYPLNSETQSLVSTGYADLIADEEGDHAAILQAKASLAHERANAAMEQALALANEAQASQGMADAVEAAAQAAKVPAEA